MKKHTYKIFLFFVFTTGVLAQKNESTKDNLTESSTQQNFYKSAKIAGLSEAKINELLKIIDQRNEVLKYLDTKKKEANAPYSIQDPGTLYNFKINNARNYYARKINTSLTYKEYCAFAENDYAYEAAENAKIEYQQLIQYNSNLDENQKKKLRDLIYNFHINHLLTSGYYNYDKTIQKPKLGILRFNFEKDFKKMCKEYNIKTSGGGEGNTNGFQWN
ncbi:hypothetical protein C8C83_1721 [Flavobacterium sp. 90]|uniref:hypothetical protein n=1 Tax=unclassified Flavobacterium TaxID=196869 RepID=UPI000EB3CA4C|nr:MULTISPECIES: hypothetical protein [unclassified Flavobacterium]RKR10053.1 hypothetical protein C8C82_2023 [Flavobacterium sp. 81]TCK53838.1 hypothetical protein C8C83_1721 [Flavobacterium sp. 90]